MRKFILCMMFPLCVITSGIAYSHEWSKDAIDKVQQAKVMIGDPDGNFRKDEPATREEVAVALDRVIDKKSGDIYVYEPKKINWIFSIVICAVSFAVGIVIGIVLKNKPMVVNVEIPKIEMPEINPVINVGGGFSNISGKSTYDVESGGAKTKKDFSFEEEKFRPTAGVFKNHLESEGESFVKPGEERASEKKEDISKDLQALKNFMRGDKSNG